VNGLEKFFSALGMPSMPLELYSPFSPEECFSRLTAQADTSSSAFSLGRPCGTKPVVGILTRNSFNLRKRIGYQNSFQTRCEAEMRAEGAGTILTGTMGATRWARYFLLFWFTGLTALAIPSAIFGITALLHGAASRDAYGKWAPILQPSFMLLFGFALVRVGRYFARDEERFLLDFLTRTLDAKPPSGAAELAHAR